LKATMRIENTLRSQGYNLVCGIDEVGRGSLAGPLVAASVILPQNWRKPLKDSKQLSPKTRQELSKYVVDKALAYGIGWVSNQEIDQVGLANSLQLAYLRALEAMDFEFSIIVLDGNVDYLKEYEISQTIVSADQKVACVAAASIIAKVARDEFMRKQANIYHYYGFENNVGYGTSSHLEAIKNQGISRLHRNSFCRKYI
jgi:ribonuclease HII